MRVPLLSVLATVSIAAIGYRAITDLGWFDSFYMALITVSTVGFGEVGSLGHDGRIWTMLVIIAGYGVLVSISARFTALLLSGTFGEFRIQKRRARMLQHLSNHVIVVGFGRVGLATVEAIVARGIPCAVIEMNEFRSALIEDAGAVPVIGDARDIGALERAHVDEALALVTTLTDQENIVVISSARITSPDLRIVSRVGDTDWSARLLRAGANDLVPIYLSAGQHLAVAATTRGVRGVMAEEHGFVIEELVIQPESSLVGLTPEILMERHPGIIVLGVRRDQNLSRWHEIKDPIKSGDVVILAGLSSALQTLVT